MFDSSKPAENHPGSRYTSIFPRSSSCEHGSIAMTFGVEMDQNMVSSSVLDGLLQLKLEAGPAGLLAPKFEAVAFT